MKFLINMILAYIIYPFRKHSFKGRNIWIVGGNAGDLYVDNGRAIYEYLRTKEQKDGVEVFWVANANSLVFDRIPGNVLVKGSIDAYLYFMNAKVVLFSHSISADIVPNLFVVPFINRFHKKVYKVFLNHGTVGFKKRLPMKPKLEKIIEKLIQSYDLNICDSEFEKAIKRDDWKIDDEKIKVTGYPRYDKLYDIDDNSKSILFMPTWRNWIRPENTKIEDTEYFENIIGLITNDRLTSYLEEQGMQLSIYIHQLMQAYLDNFKKAELSKNVIILPIDADITEELMKAELLITDYSSVAYDFYYMNKPILFFQFDKEEYQQKVGSYVDLDNGLFGQPVYTMNDCVNEIIEISKRSFQYDKKYEEINEKLRKKYLKYEDKENCERIYEIIKDGLRGK